MKDYLIKLFNKCNRKPTFILFCIGIILIVLAFIAGISDNPPGIILCYSGITALMLGFLHPWRRIRNYLFLLLGSVTGFAVFVILHNLLYALAEILKDVFLLARILGFIHILFFIAAVLICPAGILAGIFGILILCFRKMLNNSGNKKENT